MIDHLTSAKSKPNSDESVKGFPCEVNWEVADNECTISCRPGIT